MSAELEPQALPPTRQESESTALMQIIERAATDKDMDVAKLEKLLELKRQWDADNARKAFSASVADFQARCPTVFKSRTADRGAGGKYQYAPLDEVLRTIRPHLEAAGLAVRFDSEVTEQTATAICHLSHRDGHVETSRFTVPIDVAIGKSGAPIMNATQGVGSANSYAKRYALCNALNLVGSEFDDDGNAAGTDCITEQQAITLNDYIESLKVNLPAFLRFMNCQSIETMPASYYSKAIEFMKNKEAKK